MKDKVITKTKRAYWMIVRYRSLGDSGDIYSILCYLPATNLQKVANKPLQVRCFTMKLKKTGK